jgi:hypothetical protein
MKKVIFLLLFLPLMARGQVAENFESGSCSNWLQPFAGRWKADSLNALSGHYSLHHIYDNTTAGNDRIALQVKNLHPDLGPTTWSFTIRHGYDPSSTNNWAVFLMSEAGTDGMTASGTNGYAIGVNITGSDDTLKLIKFSNGGLLSVISTSLNWQTVVGKTSYVKIEVRRSVEGQWIVNVYKNTGEIIKTASGNDPELFNHDWFGIVYKYTATGDRLLWVDDISIGGDFRTDLTPPELTGCIPVGKNSVRLSFNEPPSEETMKIENIHLNGSIIPKSIEKISPVSFTVNFGDTFENHKENTIAVGTLCDVTGNCSENAVLHFTSGWVETGDVAITEIMADPDPEVDLPAKEYIEITNRTGYKFNIKKWKLASENQVAEFPETVLGNNEIMIICAAADTALFRKYGRVTGLKSFPSLTDEGKLLYLTDSTNTLIHGVEYTSGWYSERLKSNGGWSLEMVDINYPFNPEKNWKASEASQGGTPGVVNSVTGENTDTHFEGLNSLIAIDDHHIDLDFPEYVSDPVGLLNEIKIEGITLKEIRQSDPLSRSFILETNETLQKGKSYSIRMPGFKDFNGNIMIKRDFTFGLPEKALTNDIRFNEILFNPLPGDPDFIELFNCSDRIIDASRLQIVTVSETSDTSDLYRLSDENRCIFPQSFYVITTDKTKLLEAFPGADTGSVYQVGSMPSMPDDNGHLILFNRELNKIDEMIYYEKMHSQLLRNYEGITLEKQSPELESSDSGSWHSASESTGWGTPGYANSAYSGNIETTDLITFSSERITPDSDGYEDMLMIGYNPGSIGNILSVTIFDETGNLVRKLAANMLVNSEASVTWDGTADDGNAVNTGIYIILISAWDETGRTSKWKRVCAVIR